MRLVVATRSRHKLRELRLLLALESTELLSLEDLAVPGDPVEDATTYEANAAAKARWAVRETGLPALADDSGLEVDALGGAPGVRTRRYAGEHATDDDNNRKLLNALEGRPPVQRGARYVCVLAIAVPADRGPRGGLPVRTRRGICAGRIATRSRGGGGFGYDPIFEPDSEPGGGRTVGELTTAEKNEVSHRAQAARAMRERLIARGY